MGVYIQNQKIKEKQKMAKRINWTKSKRPAEEFRKPMLITHYIEHTYDIETKDRYTICPRCGAPTRSDYQAFCASCGQALKWGNKRKLKRK